MKILVFLVTYLSALISAGHALQCYQCDSFKKSDCIQNGQLTKIINCPPATFNAPQFCSYKEIYDSKLQATKTSMGCDSGPAPQSGVIDWQLLADNQCRVTMPHLQPQVCRICLADLCNTEANTNTAVKSYSYHAQNIAPQTTPGTGAGTAVTSSLFVLLCVLLVEVFVYRK